jgi:hypothetical protein
MHTPDWSGTLGPPQGFRARLSSEDAPFCVVPAMGCAGHSWDQDYTGPLLQKVSQKWPQRGPCIKQPRDRQAWGLSDVGTFYLWQGQERDHQPSNSE